MAGRYSPSQTHGGDEGFIALDEMLAHPAATDHIEQFVEGLVVAGAFLVGPAVLLGLLRCKSREKEDGVETNRPPSARRA